MRQALKVLKMAISAMRARTAVTLFIALAAGLSMGAANAQVARPKAPIYGVTLDDLSNLDAIVASLTNLPYKPTVRVVFDPGTSAASYYKALVRLHSVAYVMGEIMDSYYFPMDAATYTARTKELVTGLAGTVDVWEIANEINGEWLRAHPSGTRTQVQAEETAIGQMVASAYDIVKASGGLVAVTLYYNDDGKGNNCYEKPADSWRTWSQAFLPSRVLQGTDYALLSYYSYQDCTGLQPQWATEFALLEKIFPNAKVGFGEIGTSSTSAPTSVQQSLITTYYPMADQLNDPRFIGGYFWWNYAEQMVPYQTSSYWQLLRKTIAPLRAPN
ncbi:hypothetical protein [Cupriavidus basilensis]